MSDLIREIRQAARGLRRGPALTATAILALGLGIGATTALFSVVHAVLLAPLPYADPDELVVVWGFHPDIGTEAASYPDFLDWRQNRSFVALAAVSPGSVNLTGDGEPVRLLGARATANLFSTVGLELPLGRGFSADEEIPGQDAVVVLSDALWRSRFGADRGVIGGSIRLDGVERRVIGVAPPGFRTPRNADLWTPLALDVQQTGRRSDFLLVLGRLRPGVGLGEAQSEMTALAARLEATYPDSNARWSIRLVPLAEQLTGDVKPTLRVLFVAVALLLLVACANVASLLLARSVARRREMAIRSALGAGRGHLVRQTLVEGALLAVLGAAAGLGLATWGTRLLVALAPPDVPRLAEAGLHLEVLLFALGVTALTGLAFGLVPAWRSRGALNDELRERSATAEGRGRQLLIVAEIAVSLVLAIGAALAARSFANVLHVELGFRPERLLSARLALPAARYGEPAAVASFYDQLLTRVRALPGVEGAALVNALPTTGGGPWWSISLDDRPDPTDGSDPDANVRVVDPGYLRTIGIALLRGRGLDDSDRDDAARVVLVNETMARRFWPDGDPLGHHVSFDGADGQPIWREIVGVVADVPHEGLDRPEVRGLYVPHAQRPFSGMTLVVRAHGEPLELVGAVREAVRAIDPEQPVYAIDTMTSQISASLTQRRFSMQLLGAFAVIALTLAAIGTYGVVAYSVARRRRELGVRMALGAGLPEVVGLVLGHGARLAAIGAALGIAAALALTRGMRSLLFGLSATDPVIFVLAPAALVLVAVLASVGPARRAARLDPAATLRDD